VADDVGSTAFAPTAEGLRIQVLAQPRASRDAIVGVHDGQVKVALTSPPVDGEANAALVAFVAKALRVTKKQVVLMQGEASRRKVLLVKGEPGELAARLEALLSKAH
jgi:uncharacterized protein (TIGR00251 family)